MVEDLTLGLLNGHVQCCRGGSAHQLAVVAEQMPQPNISVRLATGSHKIVRWPHIAVSVEIYSLHRFCPCVHALPMDMLTANLAKTAECKSLKFNHLPLPKALRPCSIAFQ